MANNLPRRDDLARMTDAESKIVDAMFAVAALGDPALERAEVLLQQAKDLVGDFVDGKQAA